MAYRYGNRYQGDLFPPSINDLVPPNDPVRVYDEFINSLDFEKLGIEINEKKVGNSSYDPKAMLKLLVYGYSYGWRSARKLERALHHNISFIYLVGGLKPDYKTIAEFRRKNKKALKKVLKQSALLCMDLGFIEGNTLFVDGTKIRANASINKNNTLSTYFEELKRIDKRIDAILKECQKIDNKENKKGSLVKLKEELSTKEKRKARIEEFLEEYKELEKYEKAINGEKIKIVETDPESKVMKSRQGSHPSYNVQSVVDDKNGLIVHMEATDRKNDLGQLSRQVEKAEEVLGKESKEVCGDAGYCSYDDISSIDNENKLVIVPSRSQATEKEAKKFDRSKFIYDEENDCYICPGNKRLTYRGINRIKKVRVYAIEKKSICLNCIYYGRCTTAKRGRKIYRYLNEEIRIELAKKYKSEKGQEIYKRRKEKVEHPFGHIKRTLGMRSFLLRGKEGADAEIGIAGACFNIARLITLSGGVIGAIQNIRMATL